LFDLFSQHGQLLVSFGLFDEFDFDLFLCFVFEFLFEQLQLNFLSFLRDMFSLMAFCDHSVEDLLQLSVLVQEKFGPLLVIIFQAINTELDVHFELLFAYHIQLRRLFVDDLHLFAHLAEQLTGGFVVVFQVNLLF
jgi:hypothetical protein